MKQHPILFSAPMVRALIAGTKTQTRRIVKPQFAADANPAEMCAETAEGWQTTGHSGMWWDDDSGCADDAIKCPYGQPGDRLWVREAWYCDHWAVQKGPYIEAPRAKELLYYRATDCDGSGATYTGFSGESMCNPWRPSIHMPRWASRITLEIVSVRVERLQDISDRDCESEGVRCETADPMFFHVPEQGNVYAHADDFPRGSYRHLWESINGAGSWTANPWVWVVEFRRVES